LAVVGRDFLKLSRPSAKSLVSSAANAHWSNPVQSSLSAVVPKSVGYEVEAKCKSSSKVYSRTVDPLCYRCCNL